jgi:hypothetical protein
MLQVYEDIATVITAYPIYHSGSNLKLVLVRNVRRESRRRCCSSSVVRTGAQLQADCEAAF